MFEEYDEYFDEPSRVDGIVIDALDEIKEIMADKVKEAVREAKECQTKMLALRNEVMRQELQLKRIKEEREAEAKKLEQDRFNLPRAFVQRIVDDLTHGFKPGDTCWRIRMNSEQSKCPDCDGEKEVRFTSHGGEEKTVKCPTCNGTGVITTYTPAPKKETVEEVRLRLCFEERGICAWKHDTIFLHGGFYGTTEISADKLYRTKEECEAAIADREGKDAAD